MKLKFPKFRKKTQIYIIPTRYGFLYGGVILSLLLVATEFGNRSLLIVLALLITVALISMYITHSNLENLEILNAELKSGFSGEDTELKIRAQSQDGSPLLSINVHNTLCDILPGNSYLPPINVQLKTRGLFQIDELKVSTVYPFGLFYAWSYWKKPIRCFVYPKKIPINEIDALLAKDPQEEDFLGHRNFSTHDSARKVDWKVFARTKTLKTKIFESSTFSNPILQFQTAPGENTEIKLSFLATAVNRLHNLKVPYGLTLPGVQIEINHNTSHYLLCLQMLAEFHDSNEKNPEVA